jgi:hypothetical protein
MAEVHQRTLFSAMKPPGDKERVMIDCKPVMTWICVTDFSHGFARINRRLIFVYEPAQQPNGDFLKAKLGDKVRLERFDGDGHGCWSTIR